MMGTLVSVPVLSLLSFSFPGLFKKKVLFFPGCTADRFMKDQVKNWRAILDDLDVDHIEMPQLNCCGASTREAGYAEDFHIIMKANKKMLKDYGVGAIISPCPSCVYTFNEVYDIPARHTSQVLAEKKERIGKGNLREYAYMDSCVLARKLGVTDEPRACLAAANCHVIEFAKNKEKAACCGASGGMERNDPALAKALAEKRLAEAPASTIVVSSPFCYMHLSKHAKDHKILEVSEVFVK
jgi:Fe-S oxidoreductase